MTDEQIEKLFWWSVKNWKTAGLLAFKNYAKELQASRATPADQITAKQQCEELNMGESQLEPLERLRLFCSFAMSGKDWLDSEELFDAVIGATPDAGEKVDASSVPVAWLIRWPNGNEEVFMDLEIAKQQAAMFRTKPVPLHAAPPCPQVSDNVRDARSMASIVLIQELMLKWINIKPGAQAKAVWNDIEAELHSLANNSPKEKT